jgi:predicted ATPase
MRIEKIHIKAFKRFTDLQVGPIPRSARLIVLVGPNGCGKSSLLEAFNHWHALRGWRNVGDQNYLLKDGYQPNGDWDESVNISFHDIENYAGNFRDKFYFRTAFRNEFDLNIQSLRQIPSPVDSPVLNRFISNETCVSQNYQRLVGKTLRSVFDSTNQERSVAELRTELIGKINSSLQVIFDDLELSSIGDPLHNPAFYFKKGESTNFHYKNLSAGEKSIFDLILDISLNSNLYSDAVFFIDEPEAHIHTEKQADVLRTLFNLIPSEGQLWCTTHSLGMILEAHEIEISQPGEVVFIDFSNRDFDLPHVISASPPDRQLWNKTLQLTLGSLSRYVGPDTIYLCEGDPNGTKNRSFDAQVLDRIFGDEFPRISFISVGNSDDVTNLCGPAAKALQAIFPNARVKRVVDRDFRSENEVRHLKENGVCVLSERHLESYLLSDEIIKKLCLKYDQADLIEEALQKKEDFLQRAIRDGQDKDNIKLVAGLIVEYLRRLLQIRNGGNATPAFLRDTMAPLITHDTSTYRILIRDLECKSGPISDD